MCSQGREKLQYVANGRSTGEDNICALSTAGRYNDSSRQERIGREWWSSHVWILSLLEALKHVVNTLHVLRVHHIGLAIDLSVLGREELDAAELVDINLVLAGRGG